MAADGAELGLAQCHERLLASSSGFMSCTRFAMPLVVPVELDCFDHQIVLTVHDRRLCGPLPGHVAVLSLCHLLELRGQGLRPPPRARDRSSPPPPGLVGP